MDFLQQIFENEKIKLEKQGLRSVSNDINAIKDSQIIKDYNRLSIEKLVDTYDKCTGSRCGCVIKGRVSSEVYRDFVGALCFYIDQLILSGLSYEEILSYLTTRLIGIMETKSILDEIKDSHKNWNFSIEIEKMDIGEISERLLNIIYAVSKTVKKLRTFDWSETFPLSISDLIFEKEKEVGDTNLFSFYYLCSFSLLSFLFDAYELGLNEEILKQYYNN